jgi:hypothetical protein
MRKLSSLAGAVILAATAFATPAHAQAMSAGGICGPSADNLNFRDVNSDMQNRSGETVPALFYRVDYSGVPAPTTVGIIVRYNGELETQTALATFVAQNSGGSQAGVLTAAGVTIQDGYVVAVNPATQGFNNSIDNSFRGRSDNGSVSMKGKESQATAGVTVLRGGTGQSGTQGGLLPGEYVFYVYTGETKDVWNIKDGVIGSRFVADEKGYLGTFACSVSTGAGTGPG